MFSNKRSDLDMVPPISDATSRRRIGRTWTHPIVRYLHHSFTFTPKANLYQVNTLPAPLSQQSPHRPHPRPRQLVLRMQFQLAHCSSLLHFSTDRTLRRCTSDPI